MDSLEECRIDDGRITTPPWGEWGRSATLGVIAGVAKLLLNVLNTTEVTNHKTWMRTVTDRQPGVGLFTISNHTSLFDDPGLFCAMTPWSYFWSEHRHHGMRWTMCAKEVCFKNELLRQFFQNGKVMPIVRGGGVDQPVMGTVARLVARGDWVHVFPEGRVMMNGELGPFRWGVGKAVCDARGAAGGRDPVILPFYHSNMGSVLPINTPYLPRFGHTVSVTVGQPLDLSDLTCRCHAPGEDVQKVWTDITLRLHDEMKKLERVSRPNPFQQENPKGKPGAEAMEAEKAAQAKAGGAEGDARLAGRA
ncbi:hypothetical protein FOA52_000401 [Chlamydomonas sp. UWO 241]|nr:hypothetical protein FOA52_000401 [Chlamydomonas sp. UWO 241]